MAKKISVDIELMEDLSSCMQILFDIVRVKHLTDDDIDKLKYVNKLVKSVNELFQNSKPV